MWRDWQPESIKWTSFQEWSKNKVNSEHQSGTFFGRNSLSPIVSFDMRNLGNLVVKPVPNTQDIITRSIHLAMK